jgi:two-component system, OmpR family, response regulator
VVVVLEALENYAGSLLLVEDDKPLSSLLQRLLTGHGYQVDPALDGQRGLHLALTRTYHVIVLDRTLPAIDGLDLLARLRQRGVTTPVLILSALALPQDRINGLDAGAEDYLSKPFDSGELLARLRALLRRHAATSETIALPYGQLSVSRREIALDGGNSVALTERECSMLEVLARRRQQIFSRDELMRLVFPEGEDDGLVGIYVHHIRKKLGKNAIETVRGLGYRLGRG